MKIKMARSCSEKREKIHVRLETSGSWQELFSNVPLLAAFVTHLDEPVKKFAGMVSQFAGGVATAMSDQDAYAFCEALFYLEIANKMVYQTPSSFLTEYSPGQVDTVTIM